MSHRPWYARVAVTLLVSMVLAGLITIACEAISIDEGVTGFWWTGVLIFTGAFVSDVMERWLAKSNAHHQNVE